LPDRLGGQGIDDDYRFNAWIFARGFRSFELNQRQFPQRIRRRWRGDRRFPRRLAYRDIDGLGTNRLERHGRLHLRFVADGDDDSF
jgi:hypothetical protein